MTYHIVEREPKVRLVQRNYEVQHHIRAAGVWRAGHGRRHQRVQIRLEEGLLAGHGARRGVRDARAGVAEDRAVGCVGEAGVAPGQGVGLRADPVVIGLLVRVEDEGVALGS